MQMLENRIRRRLAQPVDDHELYKVIFGLEQPIINSLLVCMIERDGEWKLQAFY